jgi:hypothetical protein
MATRSDNYIHRLSLESSGFHHYRGDIVDTASGSRESAVVAIRVIADCRLGSISNQQSKISNCIGAGYGDRNQLTSFSKLVMARDFW